MFERILIPGSQSDPGGWLSGVTIISGMRQLLVVTAALLSGAAAIRRIPVTRPARNSVRSGGIRAVEDFDPFASKGRVDPLPPRPAPDTSPAVTVGYNEARGARILGAVVGGTTGNQLWAGLESLGLTACSPFDLDACAEIGEAKPAAERLVSSSGGSGFAITLPPEIEAFLRNPASILPQGFVQDLNADVNARYGISSPAPPEVEAAKAMNAAEVVRAATTDAVAPEAGQEVIREGLDLASAWGVPPAYAADALPSHMESIALFDPSQFASVGPATALDSVAFNAIADTGSPLASLLVTALSAGVGALFFEYMATSAMPLGPGSGSAGALFKVAGKYTDIVVVKVWSVAGPAVKSVRQKLPF